MDHIATIEAALTRAGLAWRGGFHPAPADGVPDCGFPGGPGTLVLAGNAGGGLWPAFERGRRIEPDPLDRWTERTLGAIAAALDGPLGGVAALYPFSGPPHLPFQRWAMRAEAVHPSPIGPLIHPDHGLWHAYRGALAFAARLALPPRDTQPSPCVSCADRPCLATCPVAALTPQGYDVAACAGHLRASAGDACLAAGCLARRACPVGRQSAYGEAQARFHMTAFLAARARD